MKTIIDEENDEKVVFRKRPQSARLTGFLSSYLKRLDQLALLNHKKGHTAMTVSALAMDAAETTFHDVDLLIKKTVHQFCERYNCNFEEYHSETNPMFMIAYTRWGEKRFKGTSSSFPSYVRWVVWHGLLEMLRKKMRRGDKVVCMDLHPDWAPVQYAPLLDFMDELSEDAKEVVQLTLETPKGIAKVMREKGGTPHAVKTVLREYLVCLGWTGEQVLSAFEEIADALRR